MKRKKLYIILSIIVIALLAIVFFIQKMGKKQEGIEIETTKLTKNTIVEKVSATGKIQPEVEVKISSEVSGEIIELRVVEGQVVSKGDLLVRINPDLYQSSIDRSVATLSTSKASMNQADAQLKEAKLNYDRNKVLLEKGVISKSEWDKIVSAYEVAVASKNSAYYNVQASEATVKEAKDNMNRTSIFAPVAGTISRLDVELGERVLGTQQMAGTDMMRVANLNNMEVEVDVNENDIVKIAVGNEAIIEVDAYLKKEFKGIVTSISNSADDKLTADQVTNFKVKVRLLKESYADLLLGKPDTYSPFRPGMTATVDIISSKKENVYTVPISAVVMKSKSEATTMNKQEKEKNSIAEKNKESEKIDKKFEAVFVKNGEVAEIRFVTTGIQDDENIEIISGLKEGDEIISGPYSTVSKELKQGDKVFTKSEKNKK